MPEFQPTRDQLLKDREASAKANLDVFAAGQRLRLLEKKRDGLERQKGDRNESYLRRRDELEEQIEAAKRKKAELSKVHAGLRDRLIAVEREFGLFVDPRRELAANFPNETPFLLFPLRMETRFKTVGGQPQLWVRVYPDDCLVDSFEPLLSRKEVNNAARFWAEFYSAGKPADPANPDPATIDLQKAAWRLLVGAHGDGRAAWIARQLVPNEAASIFPVRGTKSVILAIVSDNWNPALQAAIVGLFKDLWSADGNENALKHIKTDFNTANPGLDAESIIETYEPVNFREKLPAGLKREDADLQCAVVVFADLEAKMAKEHGWSQATRVNLLPERFALLRFKGTVAMEPIFGNTIPFPLPTSPDPSADAGKQFEQNAQGDLEFADPIKWVADFDRAVQIGMGFRVNLAPDEVKGFARLMVLGVKLGADAAQGKKQLEELIDHHYFSKKGFSIIPQGTPTNNTTSSDSGYTSADAADQTFDLYFKQTPGFKEEDDWNKRRDGQWLGEWLGLDYDRLKKVLHSDGLDQSDAHNLNIALWPATLGYVMEALMKGGFTPEAIAHTRDFFNRFVSGRGPVPAIRIGNQPYGILPTAAFHRLNWMGPADRFLLAADSNFLNGLYQLLLKIDNYWTANLAGSVAQVAQASTKPYQTLLDVLGLHPNSVEFHRRYMESLIQMTNAMSLIKPGFLEHSGIVNNTNQFLHQTLGYITDILPQIAALLGLPWSWPVQHLIDDVPLSETKPIRNYTADKENYITALVEQARKSQDALRTGEGFSERPAAELYRLLKYALEQGYHGSGVDAATAASAFSAKELATMRLEQPFTHQKWQGEVTASRYDLLYQTVPAISPVKTVSEFVRDSLQTPVVPAFSRYLAAQLAALEQLQGASTARLERALVEHLDCCSYRLDGWKTAILANQLGYMRNNLGGVNGRQRRTGIFLGAFGWLENVRPEKNSTVQTKEIPPALAKDFNPDGTKVFLSDSANEGYIHAPSLNQGVTAAVLRNGYISHGKPDANNVLAVNLTSERIRLALSVIEGIQAGQSLAALLGYHFERELHDRSDLTAKSIDKFIYSLRKQFPLNADQLKDTKVGNNTDPSVDPETVPITAIEARNVVHGVNLSSHVKKQTLAANKKYPFGLDLPNPDPLIASAITDAVDQITDIADAIGDLGMAESVHHVVMGNYDRAAGVLETYSKGTYPQEPDVIRTPRSGTTLTHRVSIPFQYIGLAPGSGPRAQTEPSVNNWLSTILPRMEDIICKCSYVRRGDGLAKDVEISLKDVGLKPIDLLYMMNALDSRAMNEMDDRFLFFLHATADPQIDGNMVFQYTEDSADPSKLSLFQVMPLVRSLRALLVESVPLTPGDVALPNEASQQDVPPPELPAQRAQDLVNSLKAVLTAAALPAGIIGYLRSLPAQDLATDLDREDMRLKADDTIDRFAGLLLELGKYGIPQTGIASLYSQRQQWFVSLKKNLKAFIDRWQKNSDDYAALAGPSPSPETLQAMERLISATPTPVETITLPIVAAKKALFDAAFNALKTVVSDRQPTLIQLIQDIEAIDTSPFDLIALSISTELRQIPLFIYDLLARADAFTDRLETKRIPEAETLLAGLGALAPVVQAKQIEAASRIILGDQFRMVPRYILPPAQKAEISNSWNATGDLLNHSLTTGKTNPQEDWLHGIARVHEKMKHVENCILLRQAFDLAEDDFSIHPVQLPFKSQKYHWLALPFPENDVDLEETNVLLSTVLTAKAASAPGEICGMLVDEWTELIPAKEETTGLAFHYDRPNTEAPQTLLLVTPTALVGNWNWNDLVDALVYTLDAARSRGIEPGQIDKTPFAALLPAVLGAESLLPYSVVLDNKVHYMAVEQAKNF